MPPVEVAAATAPRRRRPRTPQVPLLREADRRAIAARHWSRTRSVTSASGGSRSNPHADHRAHSAPAPTSITRARSAPSPAAPAGSDSAPCTRRPPRARAPSPPINEASHSTSPVNRRRRSGPALKSGSSSRQVTAAAARVQRRPAAEQHLEPGARRRPDGRRASRAPSGVVAAAREAPAPPCTIRGLHRLDSRHRRLSIVRTCVCFIQAAIRGLYIGYGGCWASESHGRFGAQGARPGRCRLRRFARPAGRCWCSRSRYATPTSRTVRRRRGRCWGAAGRRAARAGQTGKA